MALIHTFLYINNRKTKHSFFFFISVLFFSLSQETEEVVKDLEARMSDVRISVSCEDDDVVKVATEMPEDYA